MVGVCGVKAQHPVALDLFSGAGGLAEGFLRAGVHVAAAVELHPQAGLTHAFNHPDTSVFVGDIREIDVTLLEEGVKATTGSREVDVVIGGPPCQGFSSAGRKSESDPRNSLFRQYVRIVDHFRPEIFVLENVPGFKTMYGGAIYREAVSAMRAMGYQTSDMIVHARDHGVPQRRRRFVMVGTLSKKFEWPSPSHISGGGLLRDLDVRAWVSAGEALDDLAYLTPGLESARYEKPADSEYARARRGTNTLLFNHLATKHREKAAGIIRRIPVGGSIRDIPSDERGTKKLTMTKIDPRSISNTVVSMPDDLLHYSQDRILTVREMARLQSFDDDYVFFGKRTSGFTERRHDVPQYTQVGNAVPPVLAAALGGAVATALGAPVVDLRQIERRRLRHSLVVGSSGYSGYELAAEAGDEITLRDTSGSTLPLPFGDGVRVQDANARVDWQRAGTRGARWAPGVERKTQPNWWSEPVLSR